MNGNKITQHRRANQSITISARIIDLPQNCFAPGRSDRDGSFHPTLPQVFWEVQEQKGSLMPSASKDVKHFNLRQTTLPELNLLN